MRHMLFDLVSQLWKVLSIGKNLCSDDFSLLGFVGDTALFAFFLGRRRCWGQTVDSHAGA